MEDIHKFFLQFKILNLRSGMYTIFFPNSDSKVMFWNVFFEEAIYLEFVIAPSNNTLQSISIKLCEFMDKK